MNDCDGWGSGDEARKVFFWAITILFVSLILIGFLS